ncbi:MAG: RNA polymerase sigma-54 factor, partial [Methylocapsa sp.]|nr:RNA polymerase sigma-54 factor [Methylocapsa sp.]
MQESGRSLRRHQSGALRVLENMALTPKLVLRQSQSLVMTPQLVQAIKLLQFSNLELAAFIEEEIEKNPLLERVEDGPLPAPPHVAGEKEGPAPPPGDDYGEEADVWLPDSQLIGGELGGSADGRERGVFDESHLLNGSMGGGDMGLSATTWDGPAGRAGNGNNAASLESCIAAPASLKDHLLAQLALETTGLPSRMAGHMLIDSIDENGYFTGSLDEIATRLGMTMFEAERILHLIQEFDPAGVGARNLAECLAIQLRERDRLDPAMEALIGRLDLVAKRDIASLRKICNADEEDVLEMISEIRKLDPKPGRAFGGGPIAPVIPDVIARPGPDGSWLVELNTVVLPRLLVNDCYAARVGRKTGTDAERAFISTCRQSANWLTKSLEQRA